MTSLYPSLRPALIPLSTLTSTSFSHLRSSLSPFPPTSSSSSTTRIVMLGEATHGTTEFYSIRADLTRRLIEEDGFDFVAVEADWPDAYRVNRYIHGQPPPLAKRGEQGQGGGKGEAQVDGKAEEALGDFRRFPRWMWRNEVVRDYVEWCRAFNLKVTSEGEGEGAATSKGVVRLPAAFYGMDLYSMFASADAVIAFLERVDPRAAERARERYATLGQFRHEPQEYGVAVALGLVESQHADCTRILVELLKHGPRYLRDKGGYVEGDEGPRR